MVIAARRQIGQWGLIAVAITATGGPLALAALYAPELLGAANPSAGFVALLAPILFLAPVAIWWWYARRETSSGGLYSYVRTAAGRRVAWVQAGLWILSYALYLLYTTEYIVYDILSSTFPGIRGYRPWLEILIPIAIALIVLGGRTIMIGAVAVLAVGQLALVVALAVLTIGHDAPASSFQPTAPAHAIATASAGIALLFVCGSLPLYLGGEARNGTRTLPRALIVGFLVTAVAIVIAVFPIAANPAFTHTEIPGASIARVFGGPGWGYAIGAGVAASVAGVMIIEYVALTRLVHAVTGWSVRMVTWVVAGLLALSGPVSLIDPDEFYDALIRPSLIALWASQILAVAVFPFYVRRFRPVRLWHWLVTAAAAAILAYGLYLNIVHTGDAS